MSPGLVTRERLNEVMKELTAVRGAYRQLENGGVVQCGEDVILRLILKECCRESISIDMPHAQLSRDAHSRHCALYLATNVADASRLCPKNTMRQLN